MSYTPCAVTVRVFQPGSGAPMAGQAVTARLSSAEAFDGGVVVPSTITQTTDSNGVCVFNLFPNAAGKTNSHWIFTISRAAAGEPDQVIRAFVPLAAAAELDDIVLASTSPPILVGPIGGEDDGVVIY